jgi:hypothetical protein
VDAVTDEPVPDPVLAKRARIARLVELGQRIGYGLFGVAIAAFVWGAAVGYTDAVTWVVGVSMLVGSVILAPAIVFGYGVKAADRDDREQGRLPPRR